MGSTAGDSAWLKEFVRDIEDYPRPGVVFKDITPLLADIKAFRYSVDALSDHFSGQKVDRVLGIEARGFIVAAPVAYRFGAGFVPVRKAGKLPWRVESQEYVLEYGTDSLEIHRDALGPGDHALIIDDVLATGGTAAAAARLVDRLGGITIGAGFLIELAFLGGRGKLEGYDAVSLITYD
ncbi:MAG: adenine phosphoribosyltransferase [Acidimicrobiaceae bacterium]|jgi:adenine phosphoribosyltransferase|nr:adenine phosphoribosyltransferase [Acidimicrobiaceae bacterium]